MNEPLASAAGNAVEVKNAVEFLTGKRDARLEEVTLALAAEMLVSTGLAATPVQGLALASAALNSGKAADIFGRMVAALGGPSNFMETPESYLPSAPVIVPVLSTQTGFVSATLTREIGLAVVALGGGRTRPEDKIDHAVGLTGLLPIGAEVQKGEPLGFVHARSEDAADEAKAQIIAAYNIGEKKPVKHEVVSRRIS